MKQAYINTDFKPKTMALIEIMDDITQDYKDQGYVMTVRQLYYQMVARDHIENTIQSYNNLASIVNNARMAGLLDWDSIEDRTRSFIRRTRWKGAQHILDVVAEQYHEDMWANQEHRVFVIVEKEALAGVLQPICERFDMPLLAARGYPSSTVVREFTLEDVKACKRADQLAVILHLGDHDPSGIDMTRDLKERIYTFSQGQKIKFLRIALNMDQVEEVNPPENPAKTTDSRFQSYREEYGESSWELDALSPTYLNNLIEVQVEPFIDRALWGESAERIDAVKQRLQRVSEEWDDGEE